MGFWSSIFPGDEGKLADILWSSSTPSNGIILADSTYKGTKNDDTVIFGSKFLSYNPYKSNIYLYEGNDAIEFTDTASIVYVDLGNGDLNVLKSSDSFRYSTLLGGSGNDLFLFRPGGWGTDNLFNSTLDAKAGQDLIIFSKDKNRKYEDAILIKSNILLGDGNDRVVIDFFGRVSDGSTIKLEEGDDYLILLDQLQNADGAILDNLDIDGGGGNDTIDLSQIKIKSANALSLNGGNGFDILIAPEGFETSQLTSLFECIYVAGIQVSGDATARVSSSSVLNLDTLNIVLTGTSSISATGNLKNNLLLGNSGSNTLNGGGGDDTMAGGAGDDLIVGGGGTDIAVFSGKYLDYKITVLTDNSLTIYDNRGIDGTDQIKDISILRFSDVDKNVNDLTPEHTYTLTPSTATINEGAVLATTVTTTNVAPGTKFYYALSGTGMTTADFSSGSLTGTETVGTDGKLSISHIIANDLTTEGAETLEIKLFSDEARKTQLGSSALVSIADTSKASSNIGASVTLAVSPNSVAEDSSANLIYIFSRSGPINNALTVNYIVSGTATLGTDYTGIASSGSINNISFSAGSSTATVTVDPTVDTTIESDETVSLTLAAGNSYSIGTHESIVGIISNGETSQTNEYGFNTNTITISEGAQGFLSIRLPASTKDIKYSLNYPANVNTYLKSTSSSYSGILTKETTWDAKIEARDNELFEVTRTFDVYLTASDDSIILNNNKITIYILDNDGATYTLTPSATTINEGATLTTSVATTNVASGTTLYYSLSGTGITAADFSTGALTGSAAVGTDGKLSISHTLANDLTTEGAETVEIKLFSDAPLKAQVGSTATVAITDTSTQLLSIEKQGSVELLADASNNAMVKSSAGSFQLKRSGWGDLKQDRGGWKITAAETINSKNYVLDRSDGMVYVWEMDNNWNFLRDSQSASPGQAEFYQIETNFGIDLNRDGITGMPAATSIEKQGSIELLADASNNAMVKSSAGSFQLKRSGWGDLKQDRGGWKITAAETINSKNYVLDRSDGMVFVWEMDNNWNFLRDSQAASPGQAEFYQLETNFGVDLNRDGITGMPAATSIEKQGSVELLADGNNNAMVKSSAGSFQLKRSGWGDLKQDRGGWKITAAETINSKNYVLDRSDGMVFVWEMDNNWNFLRDSQSAMPGQAEFYQIETNFGVDLNRDGVTGIPSNTKSALMMF